MIIDFNPKMVIINKLKQKQMKKLIMFMLMIKIGSSAFCHHTSLMLKYQGNKATNGIGAQVSQIPLLKDEMVKRISEGYWPIVIEGDNNIAWIYLNTVDDPRGYEGEDYDEIETDYIELSADLFPIKINDNLRELLTRKRYGGYEKFFKTIGVRYSSLENGEIISVINYDKFEKFI